MSSSGSESSSDDEIYEVEKILNQKEIVNDKNETVVLYQIKWKDYDDSYISWEPIECLTGCLEALVELKTEWEKRTARGEFDTGTNDSETSTDHHEEEDDDEEEEEAYEVEKILNQKEIVNGNMETVIMYQIKWKDYDESYISWEPIECLTGCPEKLEEFKNEWNKRSIEAVTNSMLNIEIE